MAGKFIVSKRVNPLYTANSKKWEFYIQSFRGGLDYANGNLFTHRLENPEDLAHRQQRAYFLNYCRPLPNIYTDYLFREQAKRPQNFLPDIMANVDGRGRNLDAFSRLCSTLSSVYGHVGVLVDKPQVDNAISMADAAVPYATIYTPEFIKDWEYDVDGQLMWILLYEPTAEASDPKTPRVDLKRYRLLTRQGWELLELSDKDEETTVGQGLWGFGEERIPFAICYNTDTDNDLIGESLLVDIAPVNRVIFNWCSLIDEQIERQTFSQLIMPETGEQAGGEGQTAKTVSTASIFTFPGDAKFAPAYIGPNTDNLRVIWEIIEKHITEIYRIAMLDKGDSAVIQAQSGVAKAYDFIDTNQALATKAAAMESFEDRLLYAFGLWQRSEPKEEVQFPREFDIVSLERDIKNTFDLVSEGFSDTFNKLLYKRVVRKTLKSADEATLATIDAEIDARDTLTRSGLDIGQDTGHPEPMPDELAVNQDDQKSPDNIETT